MLGGFSNVEGVDLRLRGDDPVVTPVDQLGVPSYDELVLVAQRKRLEEDPQADPPLPRGAGARHRCRGCRTRKRPPTALLEANPDLDPKLTRAELAATLPLLNPARGGHPYGYMDPAQWTKFIGWMRDNELISALPPAAGVLSNDYLPGKRNPRIERRAFAEQGGDLLRRQRP